MQLRGLPPFYSKKYDLKQHPNPGAKSQGMKQLMAGGGIIVLGTTLIPLLSTLF